MDEPTTALDVVIQREILEELMELRERLGFTVLFITHDLSLLIEIADTIAVMYAGRLVEKAPAQALFRAPRHPYTYGLTRSFPSLHGAEEAMTGIEGSPPDLRNVPSGCPFHPRCAWAMDKCTTRTRRCCGCTTLRARAKSRAGCRTAAHAVPARAGRLTARPQASAGASEPRADRTDEEGRMSAASQPPAAPTPTVLEAVDVTKHYRVRVGTIRAVEHRPRGREHLARAAPGQRSPPSSGESGSGQVDLVAAAGPHAST